MKEKIIRTLGKIRYTLKKKGVEIPIPKKIQNVAVTQIPEFVNFEGHKIFLLKNGPVSVNLFYRGIWEENETKFVKKEIHKDDVVLDIGANIGYFSLLFAKLVGQKGKIFAFEPEPTNFNLLKKNVNVNGLQNVIIERIAVSDENGKTKLYLSKKDPGQHRILNVTNTNNDFIMVNKTKLDEYFKDSPLADKISFVKMDVEGAEFGVLKGMKSIININKKLKVLLEYSPLHIKKFGAEPAELLKFLQTKGFNFFLIDSDGLIPTNETTLLKISDDSVINIFCKRG